MSAFTSQVDTGDGPWLVAGHENYQFVITGVVPDEETKQKISQAVGVIFARYNTQTIEVDPDVEPTAWTDSLEDGVIPMLRNMAFRMYEGQFLINKDIVRVKGKVPDLAGDDIAYIDLPQQVIDNSTTLPSFEQDIEVVDLNKFLEVKAKYDGNSLIFSGVISSRELADEILTDANLILAGVDVVDELVIDEQVFSPFPAVNFHQYIKAFAHSREFDIGVQNGKFTGSIVYGIQFAENSSELPEQVKSSLKSFVVLLQRAAFPVEIIGHTDSQGSAEANNALSKDRASAVPQYLVEEGELSPERLENIEEIGKGSSEPVDSNDTEEGRNLNRRVEIVIADGKPV